jgi:hypothetical protein
MMTMAAGMMLAFSACSSSEGEGKTEEPTLNPGDVVTNFQQVERFYEIVNHFVENEDTYSEALENLDAAGIIPLQKGSVTRGYPLADALAFKRACTPPENICLAIH